MGRGPIREGMDLRHGRFLPKMCAKMKEFGPVGGGGVRRARPLDPPMILALNQGLVSVKICQKFKFYTWPWTHDWTSECFIRQVKCQAFSGLQSYNLC